MIKHIFLWLIGCVVGFLFLIGVPDIARAWIFGPSTEKECIQEYVVKTKTNIAAKMIVGACKDLFSADEKKQKQGKCILNQADLYKAENDIAAKIVYHNSRCVD